MNNAIRKAPVIPIEKGQWVLAFDQPFGPYVREMPSHLESFASRGGGWDSSQADEIFLVHQADRVMPKTYTSCGNKHRHVKDGDHHYRYSVIAAGDTREAMLALRDKLYAIGEETSDRIEEEMYRRIQRFEARESEKARRKIRRLLPQHFRGEA